MATREPDARQDRARWAAVVARDPAADGAFVFAVRTTGVYCRPSCGAKRAQRANVRFFDDGAAARAAGFRACRRCRPDAATSDHEQRLRLVATVCGWLDAAERPLPLAELAARAGYSPFHLQRVFTAVLGLSPRAWAAMRREERLRGELAARRPVTEAMLRAGFGSTSALHRASRRALGMAPRAARDGGAGERIEFAVARCSLGLALVAATANGVAAILLGDDAEALRADLARRFPRAELVRGGAAFVARTRSVVACVDGERGDPGLPLDLRGTAFQQRVWRALQSAPPGATVDYGALARSLGMPRGARAVARACAANPVAVLVPCHRVVRGNGEPSGYRWGVDRKVRLLVRERG